MATRFIEMLCVDILENLFIRLTDNQIREFYRNPEMRLKILEIYNRPNFWHKRIELLLESEVEYRNVDWKQLYFDLYELKEKRGDFYRDIFIDASSIKFNPDLMLVLLEAEKVLPNFGDDFPLIIACRKGLVEIVQFLVKSDLINPSAKDNQNLDIILLLLSHPNVNSSSRSTFLKYVLRNCSNEFLQKLLSLSNLKIDNSDLTFVMLTCNLEKLQFLLENGLVEVKPKNSYLFDAITGGDVDFVRIVLKDFNVDPSIAYNGLYPIIRALNKNNYEIVVLLLSDPRVDPSIQNNLALRHVIQSGNQKIVDILLKDPRVQSLLSS